MKIIIIITNSKVFSEEIVKYFKFQNHNSNSKIAFLPIGIDSGEETRIIKDIQEKLDSYPDLNAVYIFTDVGLSAKVARRFDYSKKNVAIYRSEGSLIENAYIVYILLNTRAPEESINAVLNEKINK